MPCVEKMAGSSKKVKFGYSDYEEGLLKFLNETDSDNENFDNSDSDEHFELSEYETDSEQEDDMSHDQLDNVLVPKEESNTVESESESDIGKNNF